MWPSAQSWNWNSVDLMPHKDLVGMLFEEARTRTDFHAGMYYSLFEWFNPIYNGPNPEDYVQEIMLPQMYDLINNYKPEVFWTDGEWMQSSDFWNSPDFLAWLFNDSPVKDTVCINDRWGNDTRGVHGGFFTPEYSSQTYGDHAWEENSGIDMDSYGFNRHSTVDYYFGAQYLVDLLVRSIAYGGNLLLDIGPRWDGTIEPLEQERLQQIGSWLQINGDAIYGTTAWRVNVEFWPTGQTYVKDGQNMNNSITVPPRANSSDGTIIYLGSVSDISLCQEACLAKPQCVSYNYFDSTAGAQARCCYMRTNDVWSTTVSPGSYCGQRPYTQISYSAKAGNVYAIVNRWLKTSDALSLPSVTPKNGFTVSLLGYTGSINVKYTTNVTGSVVLTFPDVSPTEVPGSYDWTFKMSNVA